MLLAPLVPWRLIFWGQFGEVPASQTFAEEPQPEREFTGRTEGRKEK
jgi:hypothetical protein